MASTKAFPGIPRVPAFLQDVIRAKKSTDPQPARDSRVSKAPQQPGAQAAPRARFGPGRASRNSGRRAEDRAAGVRLAPPRSAPRGAAEARARGRGTAVAATARC